MSSAVKWFVALSDVWNATAKEDPLAFLLALLTGELDDAKQGAPFHGCHETIPSDVAA